MVPASDRLRFLRHKERKFGRGCIDQWRAQQKASGAATGGTRLIPFEEMLLHKPFLLGSTDPRFVDFDLYGMLGNFLYSGHYRLPAAHTELRQWYQRMSKIKFKSLAREKITFLIPTFSCTIPTRCSIFEEQSCPDSHRSHRGNRSLQARIHRTGPKCPHRFPHARRLSRSRDGLSEGVELANGGRLRIIFQKAKAPKNGQRRFQPDYRGQPHSCAGARHPEGAAEKSDHPRQQGYQSAHQSRCSGPAGRGLRNRPRPDQGPLHRHARNAWSARKKWRHFAPTANSN